MMVFPVVADLGTLPYIYAVEVCTPGPVGAQSLWPYQWDYRQPRNADGATSEYRGLAAHLLKLRALASDKSLLPDGAAAPSDRARQYAQLVLAHLQKENLSPDRVTASAEGGIVLCFMNGDKYADIECLNSGEILGVISNRRDRPNVWEIKQDARALASAAARIRQFVT